jgi:SPP1 gp7 family putative phage head morphogenesis protein
MQRIEPSKYSPPASCDPLSVASIRLKLKDLLDESDYVELSEQAKSAQRVESKYRRIFREAIFEASFRALDDLAQGKLRESDFDFTPIVVSHAIDSMRAGLRRPRPIPSRMSAGKKRAPVQTIFELWDKWRKGKLTRQQKKNASNIKKSFLFGVQEFWKKNSDDFRQGDSFDMTAAKEAFVKRAKIPVARADLIVNTETTRYYNESIRKLYDGAEGVTHYLFVAIRDRRTTKWCCDFRKGGRDGLVYKKGDAVTDRETCPCHWQCRSQFLPLSPSNPKHLKLISDESRWRANNKPFPLPRGWNS